MDRDLVQANDEHDVPGWADAETLTRSPFRATIGLPIPTVQCNGEIRSGDRAGERCKKQSLRGTTVCPQHGGQLPSVKAAAARVVEEARSQLLYNATRAPDVLLELMENSTSDAVKLGAANSLLDRAGIKGGADINVTVTQGDSPHDVLAERLAKLRSRVVEGEVVQPEDEVVDRVAIEADPLHPTEE